MLLYLSFLFTFIISSLICFIIDFYFIEKKDMSGKIISREKLSCQYNKILKTVLFNMFCVIPIITTASEHFIIKDKTIETYNIYKSLQSIILATVLLDLFFFTFHYILHNKSFYIWSHKLHHEFKYPVGMEALYLHWFDLIFGNIMPLYLPILFIDYHLYTVILWNIIIVSFTVGSAHASFRNNNHLNHHIYFNVNYGIGIYMDRIFGTKK